MKSLNSATLILLQLRNYRPAVSPHHQEKILAIRSELSALGVATGRSRAKRNGLSAGTSGVGIVEAIQRLRSADLKNVEELNASNAKDSSSGNELSTANDIVFGSNSLFINAQVKLLKEQSNGIRGVLNLPNPELLNCRPSILVFATPEESVSALRCGANVVGGEDLVPQLIEGTLPAFNRCLATTSMLGTVMKVARVLGPKGLMPSLKTGTLVAGKDLPSAIKTCLQSVPFKIEKNAGLLNMSIGSLNGSDEQLMENVMAVLEHLNRLGGRQPDQQGQGQQQQQQVSKYIQRAYLSTRAHPGIQIIC